MIYASNKFADNSVLNKASQILSEVYHKASKEYNEIIISLRFALDLRSELYNIFQKYYNEIVDFSIYHTKIISDYLSKNIYIENMFIDEFLKLLEKVINRKVLREKINEEIYKLILNNIPYNFI